jgi:hypothetical protein
MRSLATMMVMAAIGCGSSRAPSSAPPAPAQEETAAPVWGTAAAATPCTASRW